MNEVAHFTNSYLHLYANESDTCLQETKMVIMPQSKEKIFSPMLYYTMQGFNFHFPFFCLSLLILSKVRNIFLLQPFEWVFLCTTFIHLQTQCEMRKVKQFFYILLYTSFFFLLGETSDAAAGLAEPPFPSIIACVSLFSFELWSVNIATTKQR